jgi:hypothetical protein
MELRHPESALHPAPLNTTATDPTPGGEHRSARMPVKLTTTVLLPVRDGTAWLSEACAPWPCDTYLRGQVGDMHLSMPANDARGAAERRRGVNAHSVLVSQVRFGD